MRVRWFARAASIAPAALARGARWSGGPPWYAVMLLWRPGGLFGGECNEHEASNRCVANVDQDAVKDAQPSDSRYQTEIISTMSPWLISLLVFVIIFGGALLGVFLRPLLSEHHLHPDSRDA